MVEQDKACQRKGKAHELKRDQIRTQKKEKGDGKCANDKRPPLVVICAILDEGKFQAVYELLGDRPPIELFLIIQGFDAEKKEEEAKEEK